MRQLNLLRLALVGFLVNLTLSAEAQLINLVEPTFLVDNPAAVAGSKEFTRANDGSGAGDWGRAIDSFWYNIPVEIVTGDTLALNVPAAGSLAGKFALVSRGSNQFSEKAFNVQQAGALAIIIYNNIPGPPVGMGAGNMGASVTIPVIMISQNDGLAIKAQILNGQPVNASLTNWGFGFIHDLAIVHNSMPLFHNMAIPKYELNGSNAGALSSYHGALVANVGGVDQTNLKLKSTVSFTPTGGSPSVLLQDSSTAASITTVDSVIEMMSPTAQNIPAISQTGMLTAQYQLTFGNPDDQTGNNIMSVSMEVTDSVYSKGRLSATGEPMVTIGYRWADAAVNLWGPMYYINQGGRYAIKTQFTVSNGDNETSLDGSAVVIYLLKWNDINTDGFVDAAELDLVGAAEKTFNTLDSNYDIFTAQLTSQPVQSVPLVLDGNSYYWLAAEVNGNLFLGCDGGINYFMRPYVASNTTPARTDYWAPQVHGSYQDMQALSGNVILYPFTDLDDTHIDSISYPGSKGRVPAITLHTSILPNSVKPTNLLTDLKVFPNPASESINIQVKSQANMDVMHVTVLDATGRIALKEQKSVNSTAADVNLDVSKLIPGNYFLVLRSAGGITSKTITIVK